MELTWLSSDKFKNFKRYTISMGMEENQPKLSRDSPKYESANHIVKKIKNEKNAYTNLMQQNVDPTSQLQK